MLEQQRTKAVAVDPGDVADVIAIGLQPANHGVLRIEDPILPAIDGPCVERPVVADLVGAANWLAFIQAVAAEVVVGLPGRVRCLEQQGRGAGVIAHDKDNVTGPAGISPNDLGEVDARWQGRRHRPRTGHTPVATFDQACGALAEASRLNLRQADRGTDRRHLACTRAAVVAHAVDVKSVVGGTRVDLEKYRAPAVDTDVGGKALNAGVANAGDVPLAGGITGTAVLCHDFIGRRGTAAATGHAPGCERPRHIGAQRVAGQVFDTRIGGAPFEGRGVGGQGRQRCPACHRGRPGQCVVRNAGAHQNIGWAAQLESRGADGGGVNRLAERGAHAGRCRDARRPGGRCHARDRGGRRVGWTGGGEHDVHPIVGRVIRRRREATGRPIPVDTIAAGSGIAQQMDRTVVHPCTGKVATVDRIVAIGCEVRRHIDGVGIDGHRGREVHLLPTRSSFAGEGGRCQQAARGSPQIADVRAGVGGAFVKTDTGDVPARIRCEPDPQLNRIGIGIGRNRRRVRTPPCRTAGWTRRRPGSSRGEGPRHVVGQGGAGGVFHRRLGAAAVYGRRVGGGGLQGTGWCQGGLAGRCIIGNLGAHQGIGGITQIERAGGDR